MKRSKRQKPKEPSLAERLWGDSGYSETVEQQRARILDINRRLEQQRDALLRVVNNRANIGKYVAVMDETLELLNTAIKELRISAKRLRDQARTMENS